MALEFITMGKSPSDDYKGGDIVITTCKASKSGCPYTTVVKFFNEVYKLIDNERKGRICLAVDGTRLYFKSDDKGWKITQKTKDERNAKLMIDGRKLPIEKLEKGNYQLEWDKDLSLYFIDILNKLENRKMKFIGAKK